MTYDPNNLISFDMAKKPLIQTANGECLRVEGAGKINVLPNIQLNNCLFVPNLSHKFLSIS